jgi:glycosyltransferase involved in cell wall biosynthesis
MQRICVGIYTHAGPARLAATLAALRASTADGVRVLLLGDGPDEVTREALAALRDVPQSNTKEPLGTPACFNRLVSFSKAEVYVLLESGAQVGPLWLERLLAALDADARNGLAGPSTNHCWNEQGVAVSGGSSAREISRTAGEVSRRYGASVRALTPLHSLADFCYAVRREVVEEVGAADEGYGLGPCWEMDYNIRAARAGWRGVWACAAYVQRAPFDERRRREEAQRFEESKRLYQDKFCGARLRGEKTGYRSHCRGDDCPNFAPPALIRIRQTLSLSHVNTAESAPFNQTASHTAVAPADATSADALSNASSSAPLITAEPSAPLVTCIMPTADRRAYLTRAIRYFQRQDYPNLELLIVDDGADAVSDCVPSGDSRIRYLRLSQKLNVGAKRNFACEQSRGEIIVHWDDDDWYPDWRVGAQVRALEAGGFDLCGTSQLFYFEAATDRAWRYRFSRARRPWVAGNTLAYRKNFWTRHRFPCVQVGEDTRFVMSAPAAKVLDLDDARLCVGMVHPSNTSRKTTEGAFWNPEPPDSVHSLLGEDLGLYLSRGETEPAASATDWPLVSCVMPTSNRRPFIPLALGHFARQDYPRKELIIVDDGSDPVGDLVEGVEGVRYVRLTRRMTIGGKRNLALRHARGQFIAHWDDDDWYAPDRLRYQVAPLVAGEADLTGLLNTFVLELPGGKFWTVLPHLHRRMFVGDVHGGTLVYRRDILDSGIRYPETNLAEDAALIRQAVRRRKRLMRLDNRGVFVYVRHGCNAWREYAPGSFLDPEGWQSIPRPLGFTPAYLSSYIAAALTNAT